MEEDSCYEESDMESSESEYDSDGSSDDLDQSSDDEPEKESEHVEVEPILGTSVNSLSVEETCLVSGSQGFVDDVAQPSLQTPNEEETSVDNENATPYQGQRFETWEAAKAFYHEYAKIHGFGVRTRDSRRDKARSNMLTRLELTCDREGHHVPRVRNQDPKKPVTTRNGSTQKCGCLAKFRVVLLKDGRWIVNHFHETHNHKPVTPSKQMCMKGRRHMPLAAKSLVESFRKMNVPVSKVVTLMDGETIGFDARDCYNHLGKLKPYKTPIEGDASAMASFFLKKQVDDPHFFYAILTDKDSRAVNFLWIDGRSRNQYQHFGDVVYFDTTYKKNVYKMPFAPFTGVNHHLQSIQFGCALLLDETEESFVWCFETWLKAMGGKAPKAIITDQDAAMGKAVARVFPDTRHRYCLWHIMKKFPEKLSHVYKKKSKFKKQIKWCIRGFYRISDFEKRWKELMIKYDLTENKWLKKLYDIREMWVPVYHLHTFYAGMNTTGRSEGMNSVYKTYFSRHTTLIEFAHKNDLCLQRLVQREKNEDYVSEHKDRIVDGSSYLLQMAARIYTREVYVKFKVQWELAMTRYRLLTSSQVDELHTYIYKSRNEKDPREWKVEFNSKSLEGNCECKLFESMNIPCGHLIKVFLSRDLDEIPQSFIVKRWLKGANEYRARYDGGVVSGHQNSKVIRSIHLATMANALVHDASEEDECYTFMAQKFQELSVQYKEHKAAVVKAKTISSVGSNSFGDTIAVDTQAPPFDASQATDVSTQAPLNDDSQAPIQGPPFDDSQPHMISNPRVSKTKGRETEEARDKDDHTSSSNRYKYGLEKASRKREFKQRECSLCKAAGLPAVGHNVRTCVLNPKKK